LAVSCEKAELEADASKHFLISATGGETDVTEVKNFMLKLVELTETKAGRPAEGA
jgi:hypothetical protein